MEIRKIDFSHWLFKKLYLINIDFYITFCLAITLPFLLTQLCGMPFFLSKFISFSIAAFLSALYNNIVIYEVPTKQLSFSKMLIVTGVMASAMVLLSHLLRASMGHFSVPISLIISSALISRLKKALWPKRSESRFFTELPAKLSNHKIGAYGFYALLVGIAYLGYGKCGLNFPAMFTTAFFVGMLFEELYGIGKIYQQKLAAQTIFITVLWSAFCSCTSTAITLFMMYKLGHSGQVATITGVVLVKMIQPLCTRIFIIGR